MFDAYLILILSALACSVLGSFITLRRLSMLTDAISHTVLLGIVLGFFVTNNLNSPVLLIFATVCGLITVYLIEMLGRSKKLKYDDAIGVIFPFLFAVAVILISRFARNVHIDTDMVLSGEIIFSSLDTVHILGLSLPQSAIKMFLILILNIGFVAFFYKELKISSFDTEYAKLIGVNAGFIFYLLMSLTSLTAVTAFDAIGSVLVLSFFIAPAASAYLITKRLYAMIFLSAVFALVNSTLGFLLSIYFDTSISGMAAFVSMLSFIFVLMFNKSGLVTKNIRRIRNKKIYKQDLFLMHIGNHTSFEEKSEENHIDTITEHFNWKAKDMQKLTQKLIQIGDLKLDDKHYLLTRKGFIKYRKICGELGICKGMECV